MIKKLPSSLLMFSIGLFFALLISLPTIAQNSPYEVIRLNDGEPIIYPTMFKGWYDIPNVSKDGGGGSNINGPSMIRVPDWIPVNERAHSSAQYYLYFAHHAGDYIRMAWAAEIEGPYTLYDDYDDVGEEEGEGTVLPENLGIRGVLDNAEANIIVNSNSYIEENHLASPDVIVDDVNQQIIMYFHSGSSYYVDNVEQNDQVSWVSTSPYGLEFRDNIEPAHLGSSYFRLFEHGGEMYALDNGARLNKALDASNPWAVPSGHDFTTHLWDQNPEHIFADMIPESTSILRVRHTGLRVVGDELHVFYSRRGDIQERIQLSTVDISNPDWTTWAPTYPPYDLLAPNPGTWEGGEQDLRFSETSDGVNVNQLRDPDFFEDSDGQMYIVYTGNGEDGIGIAKLYETPSTTTALTTTADAHIKESSSSWNGGTLSKVNVSTGASSSNKRRGFMKFDLTGVTKIEHAVVRIYLDQVDIDLSSSLDLTTPLTAYEISDDSWGETTINWGNQPTLGDAITTTHITSSGKYYDFNITEFAKANVGAMLSIAFDIAPTDVSIDYDYDLGTKKLETSFEIGSLEGSNPPAQLIYSESLDLPIEDITAPVITLNGNALINLNVGDIYFEEGATATDNIDGDISANIVLGGHTIDTSRVGEYIITYNVNDAVGNSAIEVIRIVSVISVPSSTILHEAYFESGWDGWSDGGSDCARRNDLSRSYEGEYSIRIRDNSGTSSSMTSPIFDLSSYNEVEFNFYFYSYSMETNEDFWLQYDDGSGFVTIASWSRGTDFENNIFENRSITLNASQYNLVNNAQFRLMCDASGNADQIFIDHVTITGHGGSSGSFARGSNSEAVAIEPKIEEKTEETSERNELKIYPNPVNGDILNIKFSKETNDFMSYRVVNILGQVVIKGETRKEVNVSNLKTGVYHIEVNDGVELIIKRFIIK